MYSLLIRSAQKSISVIASVTIALTTQNGRGILNGTHEYSRSIFLYDLVQAIFPQSRAFYCMLLGSLCTASFITPQTGIFAAQTKQSNRPLKSL